MKFKLNEENEILMYNGDFPNYTHKVDLSKKDLILLDKHFFKNKCYLRERVVFEEEDFFEEVYVDEEMPPEVRVSKRLVEKKKYSVEIGEARKHTPTKENALFKKRHERKRLLIAFDKWEKAVLRGRESDSDEVMTWFNSLLDLKDEAFINIPEAVRYYL